MILLQCCQNDNEDVLIEDKSQKDNVKIRYEVFFDRSDIFDLSIIFTDGNSSYNFEKDYYINTDKVKVISLTDDASWKYEMEVNRGAILFMGASVVSKKGLSATSPAIIHVSIYVENKLVKYNEKYIHSSCEYIYGAKKQIEKYYLYSKEN
jgi:hypothetical protein